MISRFALITVACGLLSGCMSSVRVYRSSSLAAPPKGIPFYVKTSVCKQETVWIEPQYVLTFETTGQPRYGPVQKILSRSEFRLDVVQHFLAAPDANTWKAKILTLPGPNVVDEDSPAAVANEQANGSWVRVANTGAMAVVVDYRDVFYLNSGRPLTGTTQVDAKLGPDGTLTEASAQVQEQTLSSIASTLGSVAGAVTTATLAGVAVPAVQGPHAAPENHLTIATRTYQHTHVAYSGFPATPHTCSARAEGVFQGSYSVTEISPAAGTGNPKDAIQISGSIQLPKAAPAAAAEPGGTSKQP